MKTINVVAAVIIKDGKAFAAKRKPKNAAETRRHQTPAGTGGQGGNEEMESLEAASPVVGDRGVNNTGWEFPGGKVEPGETPQQALVREIREELQTEIFVGRLLDTIEYDYPAFHLSMRCYVCTIVSGDLHLIEHEAARWLSASELRSVAWLPADVTIIPQIEDVLTR